MAYSGIHLQEVFPIDGISTIHHFEYNSDFIFKSEYHDYWTFFFVEDGIFEISQQGRKGEPVSLEKGHLYLQAPEENYSFRSLGEDTALVFTIGFYSKDENLRLLSGRDYFCDHAGAVRSASKVSDEAGASLAAQYRRLLFTLDTAIHPGRIEKQKKNQHSAKMLVDASPVLGIGKFILAPSLRWTEKLTDSRRRDLRADLSVSREPFSVKWRLNLVKCENTGWLSYTEGGYKYGRDSSRLRVSLFLRGTFYDTPDWETRIYCYERDIPGSFSVPACYGRGYSYSAIFSLKLRSMQNIRHTINLRATIAEALHGGSIASRRELKMQYQVDL